MGADLIAMVVVNYCIATNQLEHILTNLCIHLSYLEDQKNLKIYNKKQKM